MTMRLALRTDGPPQRLASSLRDLVAQIDADAPVSDIQPLRQLVDGAVARPRAMTRVLTALGAGALALAALGLFGVVSYDVARRRREIGIRMALGASASTVVRWVGVRALRLTAAGIAFGLLAAVGLTRLLRGLLFSVNPLDPAVYGIVALVLIGVALLAAYLPARRAARVDPVTVLNTEG
jgi:ABC-type antimicrobial peptide transport system permease subunit